MERIVLAAERAILSRVKNGNLYAEYYRRNNRGIDWNRQAEQAKAKEVKDWKTALMAATDPDNPRRGELMRFYNNLLYDNHLGSTIDNRVLPVQCAPFKLVDTAGNEDTVAHKLLEKPWYLDLVRMVCNSTFEGTKLIELFNLNDKLELSSVGEIPQSNFIPLKGIVVKEEHDENGVSYKEGFYKDFYVQVGGDWQLGMLNQLAIIVIAKKLGLGSWMNYIDKFGVPPIFAITDRMDTARRDELFDMLSEFQMNHFAVMQGGERIEVPANYNVDAHNTFKALINDVANSEISKRILGSTGMTDEKSFVGSAEVGERLFKYRNQVDKLLFKFYFNEEIKPRLVKLSPVYSVFENLTFEYDESETLSVKELIEAVRGLAPYFEFNVEELAKITGLPVTSVKSLLNPVQPEPAGEGQKKKPDGKSGVIPVAKTWDVALEEVARGLFRGTLKPEDLNKDCVLKTYDALNRVAAVAWGDEYYSNPLARKTRDNLVRFAGAKTFNMLSSLASGKRPGMTEHEFVREATGIAEKYNTAYLDAERAHVANSANSARDWLRFVKDKDIYRNLKYRTMGDENVRDSHRALEGTVKPVDDTFWDTYTPPNGHRCRCWLEQTNEPATASPGMDIDPVFRNNPGKSGVVFNGEASYFKYPDKQTGSIVLENSEKLKFHSMYNRREGSGKSKVLVSDFADPADVDVNVEVAKLISRSLDTNVYVRPHVNVQGYKNPEYAIGQPSVHGDLKNYKANVKGKPVHAKKFVSNGLAKANKQGCQYAVLNFADEPVDNFLATVTRCLRAEMNGINRNIKHVIVVREGKVARVSRKDVENNDFDDFSRQLE